MFNFRKTYLLFYAIFIVGFIFLFYFPGQVQAAECKLINILTDKTQAGPGESIQINVTAQKECIGQNITIEICDNKKCSFVTTETFGSRKVSGQDAINPVVVFVVPSNFVNQDTSVFLQAVGPFNTVKSSQQVLVSITTKAKFGESCVKAEDCVADFGLTCAGNTCVQCVQNSQCASGQNCDDGVCVASGGNASGQLCASNNQCASKVCRNNTCQGAGGVTSTTRQSDSGDNPLGDFPGEDFSFQDVNRIVVGFACWLTRIAFLLAFIFVTWAGFKFMNAKDDPKKFQSAKDNFKTVLWGILVIYGVYVIIATVANAVGITDFSFIPLVC